MPSEWSHPDETLEICAVCGAKHYTHRARPGVLHMRSPIKPLTPAEWREFVAATQAVQVAEQDRAACVRRILESRGLDPAELYDFCEDGTIRRHGVGTVN